MKRFIFALTALATAFTASADVEGVKTQNVRLERNGDYMVVDGNNKICFLSAERFEALYEIAPYEPIGD